jgi:hypothetical protein
MDWVGVGSGSGVVVVGSGSGSGSGVVVGVGVGVLVATQLAQLDTSTHACWPPDPAHWENVVVDAQELPEDDPTPVGVREGWSVRVGRSVNENTEVEVEKVVGSDVEVEELVAGSAELVSDTLSGGSDWFSSGMSVSGWMVAPCIQRGTGRPKELYMANAS